MKIENKILIVDDDSDALNNYARIFGDAGYIVRTASNSVEVYEVLNSYTPDLILLDLVLNDESGFDVLKKIKSDNRFEFIYIVIISGILKTSADQSKGLEQGADGFIVRPIEKRELLARIDAFLRHKRTLDDLRINKERFSTIINNDPDATLIVINDGNIVFVNPSAEKLFGEPAAKLLNKIFGFPILTSKETEIEIAKGDKIIFGEMRCIKINWEDDTAHLVSIRDITSRKEYENKIQNFAAELQSVIEDKDKFFSILAHDLRSPFNGLLGLTDLIVEDFNSFSTEELKDYNKQINEALHKQYQLLSDLLEWGRLQNSERTLMPEKISLHKLVDDIFEQVSLSASAKEIALVNLIMESTSLFAEANMIKLIIRNLISNAIKFTPRGGAVKISAKVNGDSTIVKISDTGVGISEDQIQKLFHANIRVSTDGTEKEKGTGFGLLICKELIQKFNGKIWCESEVGKGSHFYFSLPGITAEEGEKD